MTQILGAYEYHDYEAVENGQHKGPFHVEEFQPGQMCTVRIIHNECALATISIICGELGTQCALLSSTDMDNLVEHVQGTKATDLKAVNMMISLGIEDCDIDVSYSQMHREPQNRC